MEGLFDDEYEWINETLNLGDYSIKLRALEPDAGQIDVCLSQVRWNAAMPMIDYVKSNYIEKDNASATEGKVGLELGSGTGALGIFIMKYAKFAEFYLSDFDEKSVKLIKDNILLNDLKISEKQDVLPLDWGKPEVCETLQDKRDQFDFICGSDIIYSAQATKDLATSIAYFLKNDGECYLANHVIRVNKLETQFEKECAEKGLEVTFQGFVDDEQKIKLHKIIKKSL